jgi:hypothetical protein
MAQLPQEKAETIWHLKRQLLEIIDRVIENTHQRIPALKRSIQEIKQEWRLE